MRAAKTRMASATWNFGKAVRYGRRASALMSRSARRACADDHNLRLLLSFVLSAGSNCIDVGSHQGTVLSEIIRVAPKGRHIAYEPLPTFHRDLTRRFPDVDVRCTALSNVNGETSFVYVKNLPAYSGLRPRRYPRRAQTETISVATERLDDHLPSGYAPTLMKIDVEGAEQSVIEGAIATLRRHKPVVVFEHGRGAADYYGTEPKTIHGLLCQDAGLRIFDMDGNGPYDLAQFEDAFLRNERWNFVAHQ